MTRVTSDIQNMYELFTSFVSFVFKDLVLLAGIAAVMLALNWKLALVTFAVLPLVAAASIGFSKHARDIFRILRVQVAEINTRFSETIGGMRVIQLFRQEAHNSRRFAALNHENYLAGMRQIRVLAVFLPLIEVLAVVSVALIVWYGGGRVLDETLSLGALVAFVSYIRMFFRPLRDLAEKYNILQNAMASAERIFLVLDTTTVLPQPSLPPGGRFPELDRLEELRFDDVDFRYVTGEPVLKQVCFNLRRGETVAVVGATGAGKTSLISLIPRLYDPTAGRILLNGRDLREYPSAVFRDQMALVMQESFLFSGTIRENVFDGARGPAPARAEDDHRRRQPGRAGRQAPARARHAARRGRQPDLERRAPAHRHRPGLRPQPPTDPVRRSHLLHRLPDRTPDPAGPGAADAAAHRPGRRPPPVHRAQRPAHPGDEPGADHRIRIASGADGAPGVLLPPAPGPARRRAGAIILLPNPEPDGIGFFLNVISKLSGFGPQHTRRKQTRAFLRNRFTRLKF